VVAGATILYQIGDGRNPLRSARMRAVNAAGTDIQPERRLSILLLVVAAHHRMGQLVERELAADGVTSADYALLSLVGLRGPVRLTEVAAELGMPLTTASDAVKRLEARGFARRSRNPEDGRSFLVELTEAGGDEWRSGWPALRRVNEQLMGALEDPDLVRAGLERLGAAFAEVLARGSSKEATKS
jgi:DNA-binding MarR family transcriptional regulator